MNQTAAVAAISMSGMGPIICHLRLCRSYDLIRLKVDVIVTHGTPGVLAAKRATTSIPIVCAVVGNAIGSGIVSYLARPGGNVTGLTFFNPELAAKRLELLKEILPDVLDVGILLNSAKPIHTPILPPR